MTVKGKLPVVLLVVLILVSLSLAGGGFYLFQKERAKNLALQDALDEIKTRLRVTETNLEDYKKKSSDLESKLKLAESNIDKLSSDLQQEKTAKLQAQSQIEQLRADLEQQKGLRADLENKFNKGQEEVKKIQAQLKELEVKKVELEAKIEELETKETETESVELGKVVISPEATPSPETAVKPASEKPAKKKAPASLLEGQVLVVNKNYNFVVINLGTKDGVVIGDMFSIYHNNKSIGDIKVEKVHDSMSAAGFVSAEIKDKVSEGDKVVKKTK